MMEGMNIITNCSLSGGKVKKNEKIIFNDPNSDPSRFLNSIYQHFGFDYPRFYKMDDLSKLGWIASEILLEDHPEIKKCNPDKMGVVLSNSNSSLDTDLKYFDSVADNPSPSLFVYTLPNIMIAEICIRNNFKGEGLFFISESFDGKFMEEYVNELLNSGKIYFCICGWVELFRDNYNAVLFLVGKSSVIGELSFSKDHMIKIFNNQ